MSNSENIAFHKKMSPIRTAMGVHPVDKLGKVPGWILRAVQRAVREGRVRPARTRYAISSAHDALFHATDSGRARWLDHYGTMYLKGRQCLVSEPYINEMGSHAMKQVEEFAEAVGSRWWMSATSWHYPGNTIRIVFEPPA